MSHRNLRQDYLERSANHLTWLSPSTSRALQLEQQFLRRNGHTDRLKQHDLICLACGSNGITLRTAWPEGNTPSRKKRTKKSTKTLGLHLRMIVRGCKTCGRVSRHRIPGPPKKNDSCQSDLPVTAPSTNIPTPVPGIPESKSTTITSGKRRAKARREGLQALLSKSKQDANPSPAFNLMDFMRTS